MGIRSPKGAEQHSYAGTPKSQACIPKYHWHAKPLTHVKVRCSGKGDELSVRLAYELDKEPENAIDDYESAAQPPGTAAEQEEILLIRCHDFH